MQTGEYGGPHGTVRRQSHAFSAHAADARAVRPDRAAELEAEAVVLLTLGLSKPLIARMRTAAQRNGTTIEDELLTIGGVREDAYYAAMARLLGIPFANEIDPGRVLPSGTLDTQLLFPTTLRLSDGNREPLMALAPEAARIDWLSGQLERLPGLRRQCLIVPKSAIRRAAWATGADARLRSSVHGLFDARPDQSARIVMTGTQGFFAGLGIGLLPTAFVTAPGPTLLALHACLSFTYLSGLVLRLAAFLVPKAPAPRLEPLAEAGPLPVYTVLVALYREAEIVPQLIAALERLNWPRSLLDIKLVCEADDPATIAAIEAQKPGPHFEIVRVPPMAPRTKPKALNYALAGARGDFVVIYDAEDRPHPDQLREAFQRFSTAPPELACLQAPLVIANIGHSWLTTLFALEYSGLFRKLLPFLAQAGLPLPLGGTSNHFRREALQTVGAWDPHNVTEDADLGLRLHRLGYRAGVMSRQTLEDAPTRTDIWVGQRTRWLKGWMQTWLVVMRDPTAAVLRFGIGGVLALQLVIGGMLLSALSHPFLLLFVITAALSMLGYTAGELSLVGQMLFAIDLVNIFGSYAMFLALGTSGMIAHERLQIGLRWLGIVPYWLLISLAGWRALGELRFRPFFWRKTPHSARSLARHNGPPKLVDHPHEPFFRKAMRAARRGFGLPGLPWERASNSLYGRETKASEGQVEARHS